MEFTLLDPQLRAKMACLDGMTQSVDNASRLAHSSIEDSLFEFVRQCRSIQRSERQLIDRMTVTAKELN